MARDTWAGRPLEVRPDLLLHPLAAYALDRVDPEAIACYWDGDVGTPVPVTEQVWHHMTECADGTRPCLNMLASARIASGGSFDDEECHCHG